MSISSPNPPAAPAIHARDGASADVAHAPSQRQWFPGWRWMAVWPAFPVAGLIGWKIGGRVDAVDAALVGGALTAAGLAAVQWWAAKGALGRQGPGSAPAPSVTPSGWRRAPRWSATTPTRARSP